MKRYDGQVAVVTGASSGIGRRVALDLAGRGAIVVGIARREPLLRELGAELQRTSSHHDTIVCDVADTSWLRMHLSDIERRYGRIDLLINNAGIHVSTPIDGSSEEVYARVMATNYFAVVAATLAVLPGMLQRASGIVVNVSSDTARAPAAHDGAYAASKAAVSAFTESVAYEAAGRGVHVHVLYPAWVPTAMGLGDDTGTLPPKVVRRTEAQVSNLLLERAGAARVDINASRLPVLAVIGRAAIPGLYARAMQRYGSRA